MAGTTEGPRGDPLVSEGGAERAEEGGPGGGGRMEAATESARLLFGGRKTPPVKGLRGEAGVTFEGEELTSDAEDDDAKAGARATVEIPEGGTDPRLRIVW